MNEIKRLINNTLYLFIGGVVADLSAFLFRSLLAKELGPTEFGLFSLALMTVSITTSFILLGLPDGIISFVSRFRANDQPDRIVGVLVVSGMVVIGSSIVLVFAIWFTAPLVANMLFESPDLVPVLRVFVLGAPAKSIIALTGAVCLSYERAGLQALIRRVFPKVGPLIAAAVVIFVGGGLVTIVKGYVVILWGTAAFGLIVVYSLVSAEPINGVNTEGKRLLRFSMPLFLSGFIGFFLNWTDTALIGYFMTSADVGLYQSAFVLGTAVGLFEATVGTSLYPNFGNLLADDRYQKLRERYYKGVRWIVILSMAPTVYLAVFSDQSLTLLFGTEFSSANNALIVLVAGKFVGAVIGPATVTLKAMGYSRYILITNVLSLLVNIVLNIFLIQRLGFVGAAIGTMVSGFSANILHLKRVRREIKVRIPIKDTVVVGFIAVVTGILLKLTVGKVDTLPLFAIHIIAYTLLYLCGLIGTNVVSISESFQFIRRLSDR